MKRNTLLSAFAAAVLFGSAAHAQLYTDTSKSEKQPASQTATDSRTPAITERTDASLDTLRRIDPSDSEVIRLHETGESGSMLLEIGGFGLTLGRSYEARTWDKLKKRRFALTVASDIELGFTSLTGVKYGHHHEGTPDFLDQTLSSSFHFGFTRYPTLGLWRLYQWRPFATLRISFSTQFDFLMNSYAITKKPKEKTTLSGFAPFRFGVGTSISYRYVGFFVRYSPSSLFRSSSGLEAQTLSYGFTLHF